MSDAPEGWYQASDGKWYQTPPAWPGSAAEPPAPIATKRRRWPWAVLGLVVIAGLATGGYFAFQSDPPKPKPRPFTAIITVEFKVVDGNWDFQALDSGDDCEGSNVSSGYGDINSNTPVKVTTIGGKVLARTELGEGSVTMQPDLVIEGEFNPLSCDFTARVTLTKGSDHGQGFVVEVGNRGSVQKTWGELTQDGASLTLGDD